MSSYTPRVERHMKALYDSLSEKGRRRYAAIEAEKLGHCGVQYVAALFGCVAETIRHGHDDIEQLPNNADGQLGAPSSPLGWLLAPVVIDYRLRRE